MDSEVVSKETHPPNTTENQPENDLYDQGFVNQVIDVQQSWKVVPLTPDSKVREAGHDISEHDEQQVLGGYNVDGDGRHSHNDPHPEESTRYAYTPETKEGSLQRPVQRVLDNLDYSHQQQLFSRPPAIQRQRAVQYHSCVPKFQLITAGQGQPSAEREMAASKDDEKMNYVLPPYLREAIAQTFRAVQESTENVVNSSGDLGTRQGHTEESTQLQKETTYKGEKLAGSDTLNEDQPKITSEKECISETVNCEETFLTDEGNASLEGSLDTSEVSVVAESVPQEVRAQVTKALVRACHEALAANSFVHITGKLNFSIDDQMLLQMKVNQRVDTLQEMPGRKPRQLPRRRSEQPKRKPESSTLGEKEMGKRETDTGEAGDESADTEDYDVWEPSGGKKQKQWGKVGIRSSQRNAGKSDSNQNAAATLYECLLCSYTTKHAGFFRKHQRMKHKQTGKRRGRPPGRKPKAMTRQDEGSPSATRIGDDGEVNDATVNDKNEFESDNEDKDSTYQPEEEEDRQEQVLVPGTGRFKCDKCPYETDHSGHFRDHKYRHKGLKPHPCPDCDKSFTTADDLKRHAPIHQRKFECAKCSDEFDDRATLRVHLKEFHGQIGRMQLFPCEICKKNWPTNSDLEKHIEDKHNHMCSVCGENFTLYNQLKKHKEEQHPEQALTCGSCGKKCATKGALRKHLHRHKTGSSFACDLCGRAFTAQSTLYHHKRGVHSDLKPYKCDKCDKAFNFHHSLKLHVLQHNGLRPYKCDICSKTYLTATHLKSHKQAVHDENKKFMCVICNKRFPYENSLKMHMMLHTGDRPFLCNLCGRGFVTHSALKTHEASHVDSKEFQCDLCQKHYKTEALVRAHRRRHTDEGSRFMCHICGHTFMYKSNLEAHAMVHSEERKYTCNICGSNFKTYATLYSHRLVHKTETPFSCAICCKAFKSKERKLAHEKRHLGEKPFQCEICGRSFPDKGGLSKHMKTVHAKVKRFACPVCRKSCSRADNLRVHMRVHRDPGLLSLSYKSLLVEGEEGEEGDFLPNPGQQQDHAATQQQVPRVDMETEIPRQASQPVIHITPDVPGTQTLNNSTTNTVAGGSGGSGGTSSAFIGNVPAPSQQLHHHYFIQPPHPSLAPPPAHHQHLPAIQTPGFDSNLISSTPENLIRTSSMPREIPPAAHTGPVTSDDPRDTSIGQTLRDGSVDASMPQSMRDYAEMYMQYHQQQQQQQQS